MEQYHVTGMTCAACSAHVEKAVIAVDGVSSVTVSLLTNAMSVEGTASPQAVIAAVEKAGYGASLAGASQEEATTAADLEDHETPKLKKRLIASLCLLPLMYITMGHMMWNWPLPGFLDGNHVAMGLTELLLTAMVMVINQKFFVSGFTSLIHRAPNMDTLVALGATAAFVYSTYSLYAMTGAQVAGDMEAVMGWMDEFYFESAAMILTLITVGKMLEARSKGKTTDALKKLMNLSPKTATLLEDGQEQVVPISQVSVGDIFVVRSGDSIPVDGVILEGSCAVDESALTGESIPVDKTVGAKVSAATINRSGYVRCRATRVGKDTTLSQIIKMVSDAAATKAPIAKVADKVSGVFVPVVITLAVITTAVWLLAGKDVGFALARGISVLVISCPCALGLATPVAIMVGNGKGASNGILFKTAASLEAAGKTDIIAMDKTGTLTYGKPQVTDVLPAPGTSEDALLLAAFSLEQKSEHPLATAILDYGKRHNLQPEDSQDFTVAPGNGLTATIGGKHIIGGNRAFIAPRADIPEELAAQADTLAEQGKTPLYFAADGKLLGIIAVADVMKENAPQVVRELQGMGLEVVMLTGDNNRTATAIGKQIGVDTVISDVLPQGKEQTIRELAQRGKVAMVGDGINDAPALTRADVGIAIGAGTDVAIDAADVVLMKSDLADIPAAIRLSRRVLTNIHENLFWAFIYNVIGIPLAAGVWIPLFGWQLNPMFGAAAMSLSSFCVVTNALRLNFVDIRSTKHDHKKKHTAAPAQANSCSAGSCAIKEETTMSKTISIEGMMCQHCVAHVTKALTEVPGVTSVNVSLEHKNAVVTGSADDKALTDAVTDAGYKVKKIV
ncbi:MAG: heavy metal translocating P-type ATPase [Oscillospiraceae bacterium]|nr:heavy metal translocating P-type ATPase [Oscillospiraceae bacterium]